MHIARVTLFIIFADDFVFELLFENINAIAAHMTNGDARFLGIFMRDFRQLFAALLIKLGNAQADHLSFRIGCETQIGIANGFFNGSDHGFIPDLHSQHARFGNAHSGHLGQGHARAIGLDSDGLNKAR